MEFYTPGVKDLLDWIFIVINIIIGYNEVNLADLGCLLCEARDIRCY